MALRDIVQPLGIIGIDNRLAHIDYHNIKKAALILKAFNHKLRQQLIKTIHENKSITVTQLYTKLNLEQSIASQHLAILRRSGIITADRNGKFISYAINKERINEINQLVRDIVN